MSRWVAVAETWELAPEQGRRFWVEGQAVVVFRTEGGFAAFDDACPHEGASLAEVGYLDLKGRLVCGWHDWAFSLTTGCRAPAGRPCLRRYPLQIEGETLFVGVD